jgi:hypothetical protein
MAHGARTRPAVAQELAAPLRHIEGRDVASRRPPPSDIDIIEDDTDEQRHQQRAPCHEKAHCRSPHSIGVSSPLSPSQTRRGHLTATAMTTRPVPAMRPAPWRRPRQPALGQTSSHRKSRRSSVGPWQQLRQERLRKGRDGACDSPVLAKCRERLRQLPLVFRPDCADKWRMTRIPGDIAEVFHTTTSPCRREHGWLTAGFPYPGRNDRDIPARGGQPRT